jgi:ABC transporter substrate binding protein (PQQ-dependent alcohol dehydrogenase system)
MRLLTMLLIIVTSTMSHASVVTFQIAIVTASQIEASNRGRSFAGIQTRVERPVRRAVELALFESKTSFEAFGIVPKLQVFDIDVERPLNEQLRAIHSKALVILDLPKSEFIEAAKRLDEWGRTTVNVRHPDIDLRDTLCLSSLYHTIPSERMYFDALGQFLIYRGWRKVLIVHGPTEKDKARTKILERSLKKFGADISDLREFTLSHHPDDRDQNRPEFLTGGTSYDVVAVIDSAKDFGRYIQYSTRRARPVVGDVGLIPVGWHRTLERYGAPQLNERYQLFDEVNPLPAGESMSEAEFAAWSAVKLVTNSLGTINQLEDTLDPKQILTHPDAQVDLYKGTRGSIRRWNNQLRQPVLLATGDVVVAVAPMPKFLHPKHYVDTLGLDEPESPCNLK